MANISITISGSPQELAQALQSIAGLKIWESPIRKAFMIEGGADQKQTSAWNDESILMVWRNLTEGCREILLEIAKSEEGTPIGALLEQFKMSANQIGGTLSSLGHQINAMGFSDAPRPWEWWPGAGYKLLPEWRDAVLKFDKE